MPEELFAKHDPDNYRKLSEPFESLAAAEKQTAGFWEELYELRNKYKIPDVLVTWQVRALTSDGDEGIATGKFYFGDVGNAEAMAAMTYGQCVVERQERMAKHLQGFVKQKENRR